MHIMGLMSRMLDRVLGRFPCAANRDAKLGTGECVAQPGEMRTFIEFTNSAFASVIISISQEVFLKPVDGLVG